MAEYLLAAYPGTVAAGARVTSAGLGALVGQSVDPLAREVLGERGIDLSAHRARQLTAEAVRGADLILVMEAWQQKEIETAHPTARGKVHALGRWQGFEVPDPYRQGRAAFEAAFRLIERGVADWGERIWKA
ncbi:MAG: low molecular weight phosphotyrosine protein phosphatase [Betaproteobacteria bacterium]|nr:low molecular weight phosphotyrosine protein phosphatase [Betaproteobacteria bacterium]